MLNFFVLLSIAVGLSMDTFSLSILYGTLGIEKKKEYLLSIIVGVFHFIMPLIGNIIGNKIISMLLVNAQVIVGIILIIIAFEMFFQKDEVSELKKLYSFLVFGITVSLDSFSVGIGLSSITNTYFLAYLSFSIISFLFTFTGLKFGNKLDEKFGKKARLFGSIILILIGLFYIF